MSFRNLWLAIAMTIGTLMAYIIPAGMLVMTILGWELSLRPDFLDQFLEVAFWPYESVMLGIFFWIIRREIGLPDHKKGDFWALFLYPALPIILVPGHLQGEITKEVATGGLACFLVVAFCQVLVVHEKTKNPNPPPPALKRFWHRHGVKLTLILVGLLLTWGQVGMYEPGGATVWHVWFWITMLIYVVCVGILYALGDIVRAADEARVMLKMFEEQ
jgi:hypothetical protein